MMRFAWDPRKAAANRLKHGVTFDEASSVFGDAFAYTLPDFEHSLWEPRFRTIGMSTDGRLLTIAHAEQGDAVRIISARLVTKRERLSYEQRN
jgi:uncharacterized DUF497 family protein